MAILTKKKITNAIVDYEMSHPVDKYIVSGIHVWPILRIQAASALYRKKVIFNKISKYNNLLKKSISVGKKIPFFYTDLMKKGLYNLKEFKPDFKKSDFIFLSPSHARRIKIDEKFFDIYADAFLEQFSNYNHSTLIWEINSGSEYRYPPYRFSFLISHYLFWANVITLLNSYKVVKKTTPIWYAEYEEWVRFFNVTPVKYKENLIFFDLLIRQSKLIEKWLTHIRPKVVFLIF